jgi:hemerythrin-like metal-binding protein
MSLITWQNTYSVNVAEIDTQHKTLIAMINELFDAMKAKRGDTVIEGIIEKLASYTETHFKTEEKYFDRFGYAETAAHKLAHAQFVDKVVDFQAKLKAGSITLSIEILRFLEKWLVTHIQVEDKKYSAFFNEKGLQ